MTPQSHFYSPHKALCSHPFILNQVKSSPQSWWEDTMFLVVASENSPLWRWWRQWTAPASSTLAHQLHSDVSERSPVMESHLCVRVCSGSCMPHKANSGRRSFWTLADPWIRVTKLFIAMSKDIWLPGPALGCVQITRLSESGKNMCLMELLLRIKWDNKLWVLCKLRIALSVNFWQVFSDAGCICSIIQFQP